MKPNFIHIILFGSTLATPFMGIFNRAGHLVHDKSVTVSSFSTGVSDDPIETTPSVSHHHERPEKHCGASGEEAGPHDSSPFPPPSSPLGHGGSDGGEGRAGGHNNGKPGFHGGGGGGSDTVVGHKGKESHKGKGSSTHHEEKGDGGHSAGFD